MPDCRFRCWVLSCSFFTSFLHFLPDITSILYSSFTSKIYWLRPRSLTQKMSTFIVGCFRYVTVYSFPDAVFHLRRPFRLWRIPHRFICFSFISLENSFTIYFYLAYSDYWSLLLVTIIWHIPIGALFSCWRHLRIFGNKLCSYCDIKAFSQFLGSFIFRCNSHLFSHISWHSLLISNISNYSDLLCRVLISLALCICSLGHYTWIMIYISLTYINYLDGLRTFTVATG